MLISNRRVSFASGPVAVFSEDAVRHGVKYEPHALKQLCDAFGVCLYTLESATSVWSTRDLEVRVKPDATNANCPFEASVLLEIKCPYTEAARNSIHYRMRLHARQCFFELLAFPRAACLIFAVFDFDPSGPGHSCRDSALHRLNRASVEAARLEFERLGLMDDLARDIPNEAVDGILHGMLEEAVELPGVKDMTPHVAHQFRPELFHKNVPEHVFPLDRTVPPAHANELDDV